MQCVIGIDTTWDHQMTFGILRYVFFLSMIGVLVGCATRVSEMTVAQVAGMSDVKLCQINIRQPVGFVPLEIDRRRIDCDDFAQEILDQLAGQSGYATVSPLDMPMGAFNDDDCKGVQLGKVVMPLITETKTEFGRRVVHDDRHYQYVKSISKKVTYVLIEVDHETGYVPTVLYKAPPNSNQLVRFGGVLAIGVKANVSLIGCRVF